MRMYDIIAKKRDEARIGNGFQLPKIMTASARKP